MTAHSGEATFWPETLSAINTTKCIDRCEIMYFREHCPHEIPASFTVSWPSVSHPLQKTNRSHPQPIIHRLLTRCIVQDMSSLEYRISVRVYFTWHSMTTPNIFTIIDIKYLEYFRKIFFQFFTYTTQII